jgi:CHAT domain-containing protein
VNSRGGEISGTGTARYTISIADWGSLVAGLGPERGFFPKRNQRAPELLTREAIAEYRVPGSLVVMSGCSSQRGETLPSAGLIGLSRAWLLAGASAVIVSAWPTPDDSGRFFSSFYSHLQPLTSTSGSLAKRAAIALQQAQLEMRQSNAYGNSPSFWAAYSVVSKE